VVDCGSYFVTTYKRSKLHEGKETEERDRELIEETERKEKRRNKRKLEKKELRVTPRSTQVDWGNIVNKSESSRVSTQKHDKMTKSISSRVPIPVMSHIFMQNVSPCFDRIRPARTFEVFVEEES